MDKTGLNVLQAAIAIAVARTVGEVAAAHFAHAIRRHTCRSFNHRRSSSRSNHEHPQ
jgi:hypothetical protein